MPGYHPPIPHTGSHPFSMQRPATFLTALRVVSRSLRRLVWPRPLLYAPIGIARGRGNVLSRRPEVYLCGFPRSGNTFARTAFLSANPGVKVQSHRHIPAFVLRHMQTGTPGMVLIRSPYDAIISWAIHENQSIEEAAAYWNDYYEALLPHRDQLFVVGFEEITSDFGQVILDFNARWGTAYVPFDHSARAVAACFGEIEEEERLPGGAIRELRVCRPSAERREVKESMARDSRASKFFRKELGRAEALFREFTSPVAPRQVPGIRSTVSVSPLGAGAEPSLAVS